MRLLARALTLVVLSTTIGCHGLQGVSPQVLSVTPSVACAGSGQVQMQVKGTNFTPLTLAQDGNAPTLHLPTLAIVSVANGDSMDLSNVTWTDDQTMSFALPSNIPSGSYALRATNPTGVTTLSPAVIYVQGTPTLANSSAPTCGTGTPSQVRISTSGLLVGTQQPLTATWGDGSNANLTAADCTPLGSDFSGLQQCLSVLVNIPASSSSESLVITDAATCTLNANLTTQLDSAPVVKSLSPNSLCLNASSSLQLSGEYLMQDGNSTPQLLLLSGTTLVASATGTQMTGCTLGPGNMEHCTGMTAVLPLTPTNTVANMYTVQVQNPTGCMSQTLPLDVAVAPSVTAPAAGSTIQLCSGGGGNFAISGTGLQTATSVSLGGVTPELVQGSGCNGANCQSLRATFGAAALSQTGNVTLALSNGGQCAQTITTNVVVVSGYTITSVTPNKVSQASNATLVVQLQNPAASSTSGTGTTTTGGTGTTTTTGGSGTTTTTGGASAGTTTSGNGNQDNVLSTDAVNTVALVGTNGPTYVCGTQNTSTCPALAPVSGDPNSYTVTVTVPAAVLQSFVGSSGPPPTVGVEVQFQQSGCGAYLANAVTIQK